MRHIYYLNYIKFDYQYNVIIAVIQALIATVFWLKWIKENRKEKKHWWKIATGFLILWIASSFELGDFPPVLFLLDAHALWHMATIPLYLLIWSFAIEEAKYEIKKKHD